jgi:bis(5'-nucleosyl)-tetraphosphatase (symmetrical)
MRVLVVGDVHGCLAELQDLLRAARFVQGTDRLVLAGDLMDRGPDPVGCVRLARKLGAEMVLGNHEDQHVRWRKHEAVRAARGKKNPMKSFNDVRAAQSRALSDEDLAWMGSLPQSLRVGPNLVVVHAGLEPAFPFDDQSSAVTRVRFVNDEGEMVGFAEGSLEQPSNTYYWSECWNGPESVLYGHAVHSLHDPRVDSFDGGACYGLDTGCGRLTAAVVVDGQVQDFVQVQAQQVYYSGGFQH